MKPHNSHTAILFRFVRESKKISMRTMARHLKVPASRISRIESGHLAPGPDVLQRLLAWSGAENLEQLFIQSYR